MAKTKWTAKIKNSQWETFYYKLCWTKQIPISQIEFETINISLWIKYDSENHTYNCK